MENPKQHFLALVNHPIKFKLLLWLKLPLAALTGMTLVEANEDLISVRTKYNWLNKNPFKSTYWAVLGMAAELSSGLLVMMHSYKLKPRISMYVVSCNAKFIKRAVAKTIFICKDGDKIATAIELCINSKQPQKIESNILAYNEANEMVAKFVFTWSIKAHFNKLN